MKTDMTAKAVALTEFPATPEHNGNQLVRTEHVFVPGLGCFFPSWEIASKESAYLRGVPTERQIIEFNGRNWVRFADISTNVWD